MFRLLPAGNTVLTMKFVIYVYFLYYVQIISMNSVLYIKDTEFNVINSKSNNNFPWCHSL